MMMAARCALPAPFSARYGEMYPDSTPSPIMKNSRPTNPRKSAGGSPIRSMKGANRLLAMALDISISVRVGGLGGRALVGQDVDLERGVAVRGGDGIAVLLQR